MISIFTVVSLDAFNILYFKSSEVVGRENIDEDLAGYLTGSFHQSLYFENTKSEKNILVQHTSAVLHFIAATNL